MHLFREPIRFAFSCSGNHISLLDRSEDKNRIQNDQMKSLGHILQN